MSYFVQEDEDTLRLWKAVHTGDVTTVQMLVDSGVDINAADRSGNSALHTAASMKRDDIVKVLINAGANIDAENENGQTPLHLAASKGYNYIVMQLLDAGCDLDKKTKFTEMTALHLASKHGHSEAVQLIMDYGADISSKDAIDRRPSEYSGSQDVNEIFEEYRKRLHRRRPSNQRRDSRKLSKHYLIPDVTVEKEPIKSTKYDSESLHGLSTNENEGYRLDKVMAKSMPKKSVHYGISTNENEGYKLDKAMAKNMPKESNHSRGKKSLHTGKPLTLTNYSLDYSDKHKKRMQMSVFDRLTKK